MKQVSKLSTVALVSAAATLLLAGCSSNTTPFTTAEAAVKCSGINGCKGTSACKGAKNSCKGQNQCKGLGWLGSTRAKCLASGGTVIGQA